MTTNNATRIKSPSTAKIVATVPQKRFPRVNKFGRCFLNVISS
jgi:hypothetical protein